MNFRIIRAYLVRKAEFFHETELARLMNRVKEQREREFGEDIEGFRKHVEALDEKFDVEKIYTKGLEFYEDPATGARRLGLDVRGLNHKGSGWHRAIELGKKYLGVPLIYDSRAEKLFVGDILADEDVIFHLQEATRRDLLTGHELELVKKLAKLIVDLRENKDKILKEFSA
jgi:hypothetical protein